MGREVAGWWWCWCLWYIVAIAGEASSNKTACNDWILGIIMSRRNTNTTRIDRNQFSSSWTLQESDSSHVPSTGSLRERADTNPIVGAIRSRERFLVAYRERSSHPSLGECHGEVAVFRAFRPVATSWRTCHTGFIRQDCSHFKYIWNFPSPFFLAYGLEACWTSPHVWRFLAQMFDFAALVLAPNFFQNPAVLSCRARCKIDTESVLQPRCFKWM